MIVSKLAKMNDRISNSVVQGYQKIEHFAVSGYQTIERGVVGGFTRLCDKCVDLFFIRDGESVEAAKKRMKEKTVRIEAMKLTRKDGISKPE